MKKIAILMFLILGIFSFSSQSLRTVEKCRISSKGTYKSGKHYVNCTSLSSGKTFNFTSVLKESWIKFTPGHVFRMEFYGAGYKNLTLETFDYLY